MRRLLLAATLALAGWACKEIVTAPSNVPAVPIGIRAILLNTSSVRVTVGSTVTVAATLLDRNGQTAPVPSGRSIEYTSSDATIFSVSNDGVITGVAPGTGVLRAALSALAIGIPVTVVPAGDQIRVVAGNSQTAAPGTALPLPLRIRAERGNGAVAAGVTVRFTTTNGSANPASAVTDNAGEATTTWTLGATEGAQSLVASSDGFATSATFIATAVPRPVQTITVTPSTVSFTDVGQTRQLEAIAFDVSGNVVPVASFSWSSSDGGVATVSTTGLVTSLGVGTTTVAAAVGTVSGGSRVTVTLPVPQPRIGFRPATLATSAPAGNEVVAAVDVIETNGGSDAALGAVTCDAPTYPAGAPSGWLVVQACTDSVRVLAQAAGLSAGTYTATIPVRAVLASNSPAALPVTFVVTAAQTPIIRVNPAAVSVSAAVGGTRSVTSDITNIGGGTLSGLSLTASYTAGQPTGWLNNLQLSSTTAPATLTATAGSAGLVAGTYDGSIRVASSVANVQPVDLPVRLTVTSGGGACTPTPLPRPVLSAEKLALQFGRSEVPQRMAPEGEHIQLLNIGSGDVGTLSVRVEEVNGGSIIRSATLSSTTLPAVLDIRLATPGVLRQISTANVIITSTNGGELVIPVRRIENFDRSTATTGVNGVAAFSGDLYLRFVKLTTDPVATASQTQAVVPVGDARFAGDGQRIDPVVRITYAAGEATGWVGTPVLGPADGSDARRQRLTITVDRASLPVGIYHATATVNPVSSSGARPLVIPIVLEVRDCARPVVTLSRVGDGRLFSAPNEFQPTQLTLSYKISGGGVTGPLDAVATGIDGGPLSWAPTASVQPVTPDSGLVIVSPIQLFPLVQGGYPLLLRVSGRAGSNVLADQIRLSFYRQLDLRIGRSLTNGLNPPLSTSSQLYFRASQVAALFPDSPFTPVFTANGGVNPLFEPVVSAEFDLGTYGLEGPSSGVGDTIGVYSLFPRGGGSDVTGGGPLVRDLFRAFGSLRDDGSSGVSNAFNENPAIEFRSAVSFVESAGIWSVMATGRTSTCGFFGERTDGTTQLHCWGDAATLIPLAGDYAGGLAQSVAAPMPVVDNMPSGAYQRLVFSEDLSMLDSATTYDGVSLSLGGDATYGSATGIFLRTPRGGSQGQALTFGAVNSDLTQRSFPGFFDPITPPDGSVVLPDTTVLPRLKSVSMHLGRHACGIELNRSAAREPGAILCWGADDVRQASGLGTCTLSGSGQSYFRCTTVVDSVATGRNHSCAWNAIERGGRLLCWGSNAQGQLGTADGRAGPVVGPAGSGQEFLTGVVQVSLGDNMSCAVVREVGTGQHTYCWGTGNFNGFTRTTATVPTRILEERTEDRLRSVTEVRVGGNFACERLLFNEDAVDSTFGPLLCWGSNSDGQTGVLGADLVVPGPALVDLGFDVSSFDLGAAHACAIRQSNREMRCWGLNGEGQLGDGTRVSGPPRLVARGANPNLQPLNLRLPSAFSYPKGTFSGGAMSQRRRGVTVVGRRPDGRISEAVLSKLRPDRAKRLREAARAPSAPPRGTVASPTLRPRPRPRR